MKGKKILAGVISATMVLSTMAVPVFADDIFRLNDNIISECMYENGDMYLSVTFGTVPVIENELKVELYHDTLLLSTSTVTESFINNPELNAGTGISAKICLMDYATGTQPNTSSSWNTVINNEWTQSRMPNKIVVTADGETLSSENIELQHMNYSSALTASDLRNMIETTEDGGTLDLNNKTIVLDEEVAVTKNITIKNGTLDISVVYLPDGNGMLGSRGNAGQIMKLDNITIKGTDYSSSYGLLYAGNGTTIELNQCTIDVENELMKSNCDVTEDSGAVLKGDGTGKFVINGGNFTWKNVVRGICNAEVAIDGATITATHDSTSSAHFLRNVYGTIKNSTISADNFQNGIKKSDDNKLEILNGTTLTFSNMNENDVQLAGKSTLAVDSTSSIKRADGSDIDNTAVATVNGVYYGDITTAFNAAGKNDTVRLLADANPTFGTNNVYTDFNQLNEKVIELNGYTLTLNQTDLRLDNAEIYGRTKAEDENLTAPTEERGKIEFIQNTTSYRGTSLFWGSSANTSLTLSNVELNANIRYGNGALFAANVFGEATFVVKNSTINAVPETGLGIDNLFSMANVVIDNSIVNHKNEDGRTFLNSDVTIKNNSCVTSTVKQGALLVWQDNSFTAGLTVKDTSKFIVNQVRGTKYDGKGIEFGENNPYVKDTTATVQADIYRPITANTIAESVDVKFVPTADKNVYDIVVVPTDNTKVINRLSSAEFDFALTSNTAMTYAIAGAENVTVNRDDANHVAFYFDGENQQDESGVEVKIGTVTFNGYGKFTFGIAENGTNKIQTAEIADNIVSIYTGENLNIGSTINDELKVPTKNLTIKIDFNNAVENNSDSYQDMQVKVTGPSSYENTIKLGGTGATAIVDNKAEITIENELVYNTPYTVEVSGAGYRTARYTVTMNADKTLNFWNNVLDNAASIEEDVSTAKNATFLAGDLVDDGKINIYDLSAVVSYFGQEAEDTTSAWDYVRYDLNRDGKIDSTDVSYILISWLN